MNRLGALVLTLGLVLGTTSCMTQKLWDDTHSNGWVRVDTSRITEQTLRAQGVAYRRDAAGTLYIPETATDRFKNYSLRALGAPVTVVVDVAGAVGTIVVYGLMVDLENGAPVTTELIKALAH